MALDHYVSRVHLKQFSSPGLGGELMHAIRKSDLEKFPCHRKDVCRIEAGSDNPYLEPPRIIEEFLTCIEPAYDEALENLRSGNLIADTVLAIAGFVSFVITCSPTARRINSPPLKKFIEQESFKLDQSGVLPPPPKELGGVSLTEMLKDGTIKISDKLWDTTLTNFGWNNDLWNEVAFDLNLNFTFATIFDVLVDEIFIESFSFSIFLSL